MTKQAEKLETPNLDAVVRWQSESSVMSKEAKEEAKQAYAELTALQARVGDLSLLLHAVWKRDLGIEPDQEFKVWIIYGTGGDPFYLRVPTDAEGNPLLTAEAREALRRER